MLFFVWAFRPRGALSEPIPHQHRGKISPPPCHYTDDQDWLYDTPPGLSAGGCREDQHAYREAIGRHCRLCRTRRLLARLARLDRIEG
jgi:hypothetical protein